MTISQNPPSFEPPKTGFEQSHQKDFKAIAKKLPKDKAEFVKKYGVLARKKRELLKMREEIPQELAEELQVWDSHIYKTFSPMERKLIHQQALMVK